LSSAKGGGEQEWGEGGGLKKGGRGKVKTCGASEGGEKIQDQTKAEGYGCKGEKATSDQVIIPGSNGKE